MIKFEIVENVTKYLDTISNNVDDNAEIQLKKMAEKLTGKFDTENGYITRNMAVVKYGEFNPNLHLSGQDQSKWKITHDDDLHSLMVTYTGMTLYEYYGVEEAKVWWEVAEGNEGNPRDRILERDYAFYQETGIDPIALPKYARATGAISKGVYEGKYELYEMATKYLENILAGGSGYFFM